MTSTSLILTAALYLISLRQMSGTRDFCKMITGLGTNDTMIRKLDGTRPEKKTVVRRSDAKIREPKVQSIGYWAVLKQGSHLWAAQNQVEVD